MYIWIDVVHVSLEEDARLIHSSPEWNLKVKANSLIYSSRMVNHGALDITSVLLLIIFTKFIMT